jgi:hypothetical protein
MSLKKTIISKENLPPLSQNGEYILRYRIVSEDKNRTSHWSPIYYIDAKSTIKQVSGELQGSSFILGMTAIWEDTNEKSLYDVFVSYGIYDSVSEEIMWEPYFFHGSSSISTYSFLRPLDRTDITDVRVRIQLSGIEKLPSDILTICTLERSLIEIPEIPFSPVSIQANDVGTNRPFNNGAASVSFVLPANSIEATSYTVTATAPGQSARTQAGTSSPIIVEELTSGIQYSISVVASNSVGGSQPSEAVTVTATTVPATMSAPTASAGVNQDTVSWTAPASGGKLISLYRWTSSDGKTGTTTATTVTVAQEAGTGQTYQVRAENANGAGVYSANSNSVTTQSPFFPYFPYFPNFVPPPAFPDFVWGDGITPGAGPGD